ncbi:unnamed protein product [Allacma fusca]|uniref:Uncharacterized protein n=1 Tax=Allacma fusca TaxID=39272 RepID=A0A8J2JLY0_9HEXA|nr:unnamed protein product [Allacma fusca]
MNEFLQDIIHFVKASGFVLMIKLFRLRTSFALIKRERSRITYRGWNDSFRGPKFSIVKESPLVELMSLAVHTHTNPEDSGRSEKQN